LDGYRGRLTTEGRNRAKRIMALGNAVPPPLVYPILAAVAREITGEE
jgi:site-specific DNA-cytosine methylase